MRAFLLVFCLLAMTGCYTDSPTAPGPINQELTLAPGETKTVDGAGISLIFTGVTGDSRCPADAFCIQGGSATVRLEVAPASGDRRSITFETGNPRPVRHDLLTVELVQLSPFPFSSGPIRPEDYRATVRITR